MIVLVGLNHQSAPVSLRERAAVAEDQLPEAFERLLGSGGICEAVILSTCNRVEILARARTDPHPASAAIRSFLAERSGVPAADIDRYGYVLHGEDAVGHLFSVASGLDSMILGEPQILGQVKQAYRMARERRATGQVLDRLLQHCLAAAKRVRNDTGINRNAVSVAFAAVQLAGKIFGNLQGRKALLLGAGKMSDLVGKHLSSSGVEDLVIASRTFNHAVQTAERIGGRAVNWNDGLAALREVDIVVSCTGAPRAVLGREVVAGAMKGRRRGSLFIIDIAVPRDVDPEVNDLDNVYVYDIDGLQGVVDANLDGRRRAAGLAKKMVHSEVEAFHRWRQSKEVTPMIVDLREHFMQLGEEEFHRYRSKLGALDEDQQRAVRAMSRSLLQKVLHRPIRHLRGSVERGELVECAELYRQIFGIDGEPHAKHAENHALNKAESESEGSERESRQGPQRLLRGGKDKS